MGVCCGDEPLIFARDHRSCETESEMEILPDLPGGYPVLEPRTLQENELLYESTISALHKKSSANCGSPMSS